MTDYINQEDDVQFSEPIIAQKGVRCGISFVEADNWEVKSKEVWSQAQAATMQSELGNKYKSLKLTAQISDDSVRTEHSDAKPKLVIEDSINLESYPFPDKKTGEKKKMGRDKLFQIQTAFGFDPIFKVNGKDVAPHITKFGNKVAPKIDGVKQLINPDFFEAYFNPDFTPKIDNWIGKTIYCDIELEKNEKFGDRNKIARYVKAPVI